MPLYGQNQEDEYVECHVINPHVCIGASMFLSADMSYTFRGRENEREWDNRVLD